MIGMTAIFVVIGILVASMSAYIPIVEMQMLLQIMGMIFAMVGIIMLATRANKTGAIHLLKTAQPHKMLWFYIQKDGQVFITPAFRKAEGLAQSTEQEAIIQDLKSYRLFDHQVRFVPEGIGHSVDVNNVIYARVLRKKYGFESIRDGRNKLLWWLKQQEEQEKPLKGGDVHE